MGEYFPSLCFTARENGVMAGFICALHSVEKRVVFIWQLAVDKEFRQRGVAASLCEKIVEYALHNGINSLQTTISTENTKSIACFESLAKKHHTSLQKICLYGLDGFENEIAYELKIF